MLFTELKYTSCEHDHIIDTAALKKILPCMCYMMTDLKLNNGNY